MIVVSDTSPILNLARIGRLERLPALYRQVLIPSAVHEELIALLSDFSDAIDVALQSWLYVADAEDQHRVRRLREELDHGEAEAVVLAIERRADLLLVDERRACSTAASAGIKITGLLGLITQAKRDGHFQTAKPIVDELIQTARI